MVESASRGSATTTPPAEPQEEAALVARILEGEKRLYATLVERYQRRLYWSCLRLLGEPDEAEDATQEAFVRAYANLAEYDPAYRFYTWVFRIARNLCLNRLRRRKLWGLLSLSEGRSEPADQPSTHGRELAAGDDTAASAEQRELREALAVCLETLPREQRECFELRHGEEFSYAEIARTLSVPMGTVMSRLARARERMRDCLASKGLVPS